MHIFVTGATGYVGSAVTRSLLRCGHEVTGLTRSLSGAETLAGAGARPIRGALADEDVVRGAVREADAVVLAAFRRDYMTHFAEAVALDQATVSTVIDELGHEPKPLVYTSGLGVLGDTGTRVVDETAPVTPPPHMRWRHELERAVLGCAHGVVVRPPLAYGRGGGHILELLIDAARTDRRAVYPEPGTNTWPNVHVDDLGDAFARAVSEAPPASVFNAVGSYSSARDISRAIARLLDVPCVGLPTEEARRHLPIADAMTVTQRVDTSRIEHVLGWRPRGPSITDDIAVGSYRC